MWLFIVTSRHSLSLQANPISKILVPEISIFLECVRYGRLAPVRVFASPDKVRRIPGLDHGSCSGITNYTHTQTHTHTHTTQSVAACYSGPWLMANARLSTHIYIFNDAVKCEGFNIGDR
jgi:hypothetical protein